jgi:hypothetical protein
MLVQIRHVAICACTLALISDTVDHVTVALSRQVRQEYKRTDGLRLSPLPTKATTRSLPTASARLLILLMLVTSGGSGSVLEHLPGMPGTGVDTQDTW